MIFPMPRCEICASRIGRGWHSAAAVAAVVVAAIGVGSFHRCR